MKKLPIAVFSIVLLFMAQAEAHHKPTVTDRPDTAESSEAVGKRHLQIETSFGFAHDKEGGSTTNIYSFPSLFRFGIFEPLELRLETETFAWKTETGENTQNGFTDLAVGAKAHFIDNKGWRPSLGALFHLNIPTGKAPFSSGVAEPIFKVLADWDLPRDFSFGLNIGFDVPARDDANQKYARFLYAVSVGHPLPFLEERFRVFLETAALIPMKQNKPDEHTLDSGITFALTKSVQLDTFVQIGLSSAAADFATGLGFSWNVF